jgi:chemotaxis receptor (MCP) glutamine deamidase CheD
LGASIGITFWSPKLRVGALCHPLLMTSSMCLEEVQAKVFGGAEVVGIGAAEKSAIGKLNSEAAIEVLEAEGFKIIASSLGGKLGRQIQFHTGTGEVARENQSRGCY